VVQLKKGTEATPQEIMEFCRQKLAGYKICRSVTFVERMPISPMGKIRRAEIKKLYGNA
jgi:acyl-CoA synthetase (AMP-forming)/AMP-acid ligase II